MPNYRQGRGDLEPNKPSRKKRRSRSRGGYNPYDRTYTGNRNDCDAGEGYLDCSCNPYPAPSTIGSTCCSGNYCSAGYGGTDCLNPMNGYSNGFTAHCNYCHPNTDLCGHCTQVVRGYCGKDRKKQTPTDDPGILR